MWTHEHGIDIAARPARIRALFADVEGWPRWSAGIETIALHGPFAAGTTFTLQPPGQDALTSTQTAVAPDAGFTDETVVGDMRVLVHHRIAPFPHGGAHATDATEISGPDAADVRPVVTSDFPDVLAALKRLAERG